MINFDDYANENKIQHNLKWLYILDHPYRILIIGGFWTGKTNALLDLTNKQPDMDKLYLYAKYPYKVKYQFLINERESTALNDLMILKLLLSIQMICNMFPKILMNTMQIKNAKY